MERLEPSLDQARLREILITMLDYAMPAYAHVEYRLVGTGAALLHGVKLSAADVDILVRRQLGQRQHRRARFLTLDPRGGSALRQVH